MCFRFPQTAGFFGIPTYGLLIFSDGFDFKGYGSARTGIWKRQARGLGGNGTRLITGRDFFVMGETAFLPSERFFLDGLGRSDDADIVSPAADVVVRFPDLIWGNVGVVSTG